VLVFIVRRLLWAVMLVAVITLITFVIFVLLPGGTAGSRRSVATPTLASQWNLQHRSIPSQYAHFVGRLAHGDLGHSFRETLTVREILGRAIPVTASLVIGGTIVWLLLALPIGILSALRPHGFTDRGLMIVLLIGISAHPVSLSLAFSYLLGVRAHLFPVAGYCDFLYDPNSPQQCGGPRYWAYHLILPWFTFALIFAALYARMIRASLLESMHEDYVRTAYAKGASRARVLRRHVLRNALLPVVAMLGMDFGLALSGAIFIETIYGLPGLGHALYQALGSSDEPVILGVVIVVSLTVAVANLLADIAYCILDPRVRLRTRSKERRVSAVLRRQPRAQPQVTESAT
jgi:peptide/nickel transport system permease protein